MSIFVFQSLKDPEFYMTRDILNRARINCNEPWPLVSSYIITYKKYPHFVYCRDIETATKILETYLRYSSDNSENFFIKEISSLKELKNPKKEKIQWNFKDASSGNTQLSYDEINKCNI